MMKKITGWFPLMGRKKNNNSGAALIMVIVSVALITIMVTVILSMAFINYKMKLMDQRAKYNFYTAETALDEIKTGLEQDVSEAMSEAYLQSMANYASTDEEGRTSVFKTEYAKCLRERLAESGSDTSKYSITYLTDYFKKTAFDEDKKMGARLDNTVLNSLQVTTKGVTLTNVTIHYVNAEHYETEIKTDIVLAFPEIDFYKTAQIPSLLNYSLVANKQFLASATVSTIGGNAYLGEEGAVLTNSDITFTNATKTGSKELLISNGCIQASNGSKMIVRGKELWAGNILVDASDVQVDADTYVSNDLIVNNSVGVDESKPQVKVTFSGDYYGYGSIKTAVMAEALSGSADAINDNPAKYSSAIVINGAHSTVDLSNLNTLMLAGNSYIGASMVNPKATSFPNGKTNVDVAMGESISIKSNQIAYLVPAECIAPEAVSGGKNPMTASQYHTLQEEMEAKGLTLVDLTGTAVSAYHSTLDNLGVSGYQVVCYPVANLGSMVYVFMEFQNEQSANRFFQTYYSISKNQTKLNKDIDLYTDAIKVPSSMDSASDNNVFYYNGNIVLNDKNTEDFYINKLQTLSSTDQVELTSKQISFQNCFYTLNKTLSKEYNQLSVSEKAVDSDVYGNLIKSFVSADANRNISGSKTFVTLGSHPVAALLVNGDYTIDKDTIKGTNAEGDKVNATLRVVIATGDVKVKKNFEGLIVANGSIKIDTNSVSITSNPMDVALAVGAKDSNGVKALDYLKKAEDYIIGGTSSSGDSEDTGSIEISDLISYENWKKQ